MQRAIQGLWDALRGLVGLALVAVITYSVLPDAVQDAAGAAVLLGVFAAGAFALTWRVRDGRSRDTPWLDAERPFWLLSLLGFCAALGAGLLRFWLLLPLTGLWLVVLPFVAWRWGRAPWWSAGVGMGVCLLLVGFRPALSHHHLQRALELTDAVGLTALAEATRDIEGDRDYLGRRLGHPDVGVYDFWGRPRPDVAAALATRAVAALRPGVPWTPEELAAFAYIQELAAGCELQPGSARTDRRPRPPGGDPCGRLRAAFSAAAPDGVTRQARLACLARAQRPGEPAWQIIGKLDAAEASAELALVQLVAQQEKPESCARLFDALAAGGPLPGVCGVPNPADLARAAARCFRGQSTHWAASAAALGAFERLLAAPDPGPLWGLGLVEAWVDAEADAPHAPCGLLAAHLGKRGTGGLLQADVAGTRLGELVRKCVSAVLPQVSAELPAATEADWSRALATFAADRRFGPEWVLVALGAPDAAAGTRPEPPGRGFCRLLLAALGQGGRSAATFANHPRARAILSGQVPACVRSNLDWHWARAGEPPGGTLAAEAFSALVGEPQFGSAWGIEVAETLIAEVDPAAALRLVRVVLAGHPRETYLVNLAGVLLLQSDPPRYIEAFEILQTVPEASRTCEVLITLGLVSLYVQASDALKTHPRLQGLGPAQGYFEAAVQKCPRSFAARYDLAWVLEKERNFGRATKILKALVADPAIGAEDKDQARALLEFVAFQAGRIRSCEP